MVKKDKEGIAGVAPHSAQNAAPEPNIVSPTLDQMNLRDLMAMFAMMGMLAREDFGEKLVAEGAYIQANAMLEERSKQ